MPFSKRNVALVARTPTLKLDIIIELRFNRHVHSKTVRKFYFRHHHLHHFSRIVLQRLNHKNVYPFRQKIHARLIMILVKAREIRGWGS